MTSNNENTKLTNSTETSDFSRGQTILKQYMTAFVGGLVLTSITLGIVWGLHSIATTAGSLSGLIKYIYSLLFERGAIQYLTLFSFWFTVCLLFMKHLEINKEIEAFNLSCIQEFKSRITSEAGVNTMLDLLKLVEDGCANNRHLLLINRLIKGLKQVKISQNQSEVANVLETVADTDYSLMETSYSFIKFMIWLIPIFGFLGTLLGMSQAIGSFAGVFQNLGQGGFGAVSQDLQAVTQGLALAFDTTLLALILSAGLNLVTNNLQKRENDFLAQVDNFTLEYIINRFRAVKSNVRPEDEFASPEEVERHKQHQELVEIIKKVGDLFSEGTERLAREMKNLQRQHQLASDNNLSQLGHLLEQIGNMPKGLPKVGTHSNGEGGTQDIKIINEVLNALVSSNESIKANLDAMKEAVEKIATVAADSNASALKESFEKIADVIAQLRDELANAFQGSDSSNFNIIIEQLNELNENIKVMGNFKKLQEHLETNTKAINEMATSIRELAKANKGLGMMITNAMNEKFFKDNEEE